MYLKIINHHYLLFFTFYLLSFYFPCEGCLRSTNRLFIWGKGAKKPRKVQTTCENFVAMRERLYVSCLHVNLVSWSLRIKEIVPGGEGISDDDVDLYQISFSRHDNSNNYTIIPERLWPMHRRLFATIDSSDSKISWVFCFSII